MGVVHRALQFGYAASAKLRHAFSRQRIHRAKTMRTSHAGLRALTLGALTAVVLVAAACGMPTASDFEDMDIDICPSTVPAKGVSMQVSDSTLRVGLTVQLIAFAVNARGEYEFCAPGLEFASSDPGVAMVSSGGLVTGVSAGSAYIRASSGSARDSIAIKVVAAAVASIATR